MTADTIARPRAWRPHVNRRPLRPPRWVVVVAALVVALVVTEGLAQTVTPFIRRDDWAYLLPVHTTGAGSVLAKDLNEGRWLNFVWWLAIGQHSTALSASLTYMAAYVAFVVGAWRLLRLGLRRLHWALDALLGVTVFASAFWAQLLYWPGTLTPSVVVAAAGVWTLRPATRSRVWMLVWVLAVTILSLLTYPPVGMVLFLLAIQVLRNRRWRDLFLLTGGLVVAFGIGVAAIYTLNWLVFGHFGLVIAGWRHPNPLTSLHALRLNGVRFVKDFGKLALQMWGAVVVALVATVLALVDARLRPPMLRMLFGVAVVGGLDMAQALATGVVTSPRGELWTWLACLMPTVLLLNGSRWTRRVGVAGLGMLSLVGTLAWRADIGAHQQSRQLYAAMVAEAVRPRPDGTLPRVVLYQVPKEKSTTNGSITAGEVRMMLREKLGGIVPDWCTGDACRRLALQAKQIGPHQKSESAAAAPGRVVDLGSVVGVIVPAPPAWL